MYKTMSMMTVGCALLLFKNINISSRPAQNRILQGIETKTTEKRKLICAVPGTACCFWHFQNPQR